LPRGWYYSKLPSSDPGVTVRGRNKIVTSLEKAYRSEFERAESAGDEARMALLDFEFQRDQVFLEVLLDVRTALVALEETPEPEEGAASSLLDKARTLRDITRLR